MSIALTLALIVLSVGGLLAAMAVVHVLAKRYNWPAEVQRKCVHVATGLYALTLPLTFSEAWPVLLLCSLSVLVMAVMRIPALAASRIGSTIHSVERKSYGEILLAVAVGFTFFRSLGSPVLFVLPILVLTFSDAAAALTGVRYGRRTFAVEDGAKSLEGTAIFFLVTVIIAMIVLLVMTDVPRVSVILLAFVVAAFGAQLEAESWRGFDNLFVPVGLHLFLQNHLTTPPIGLFVEAAMFLGLIGGLIWLAPSLGLTRHAARSYGVLAFLILSVTAPHNAILPLSAFAAFLFVRRVRPCRSQYPDLDFLAVMAGVAAFWLFAGELTGNNAINLYNLTFAGVAAVFIVLAVGRRVAMVVPLIALAGTAVVAIVAVNASDALWVQPFAIWVAASLVLSAGTAWGRPDAFDRYRSPRAFAVALIVPAILFCIKSLSS